MLANNMASEIRSSIVVVHSDLEPDRFQREVAFDILKTKLCRNMEDSDLTDKVKVSAMNSCRCSLAIGPRQSRGTLAGRLVVSAWLSANSKLLPTLATCSCTVRLQGKSWCPCCLAGTIFYQSRSSCFWGCLATTFGVEQLRIMRHWLRWWNLVPTKMTIGMRSFRTEFGGHGTSSLWHPRHPG